MTLLLVSAERPVCVWKLDMMPSNTPRAWRAEPLCEKLLHVCQTTCTNLKKSSSSFHAGASDQDHVMLSWSHFDWTLKVTLCTISWSTGKWWVTLWAATNRSSCKSISPRPQRWLWSDESWNLQHDLFWWMGWRVQFYKYFGLQLDNKLRRLVPEHRPPLKECPEHVVLPEEKAWLCGGCGALNSNGNGREDFGQTDGHFGQY